jgi:hypothetical protein
LGFLRALLGDSCLSIDREQQAQKIIELADKEQDNA